MIHNFTREELERLYDEILFKLQSPFPNGTIKFKNDNPKSAYIPSQSIREKVRASAGPYWSWTITTNNPIYLEETDEIEVRGVLTILNAKAEGQGFAQLKRYPETQKIHHYKEAIRAARSDAFRDAADFFGVGHQDLAAYRERDDNSSIELEKVTTQKANSAKEKKIEVKKCIKCGVVLTHEDFEYLRLVKWTTQVCKNDVPEHQQKKYDPDYVKKVK